MREVSARASRILLEALDDAGLSTAELVEGLRLAGDRIDWDDYVELIDRIDRRYGDRITPEEIGARMLEVPSFSVLRRAGQLVVSPRQLYEIGTRLVAPALFSNVIVRNEWLSSGRLVVTGELMDGYRESQLYFRICNANVAEIPRLLGLPPSKIEEQVLTGRRARLVLVPPPSHTLGEKIARGARMIGRVGDALRGVAEQQREIEASITAMRTSRHELQQLIERLPDGVLIHTDGVMQWGNAALLAILGVSSVGEIVGRSVMEFIPPEDRAALVEAMRRAAVGQVPAAPEQYRCLGADGVIRHVESEAAQLIEYEGKPARLAVLRDVSERQRLREQAAISDRLASMGALAASVAHEINNPLTYVHLNLELAARQIAALRAGARTTELEASLEQIREGTGRVLGIVRNLKMLSRVHDEPRESIDLPQLLDSTLALAKHAIEMKARVVRAYAPAPPALAGRGRLGQVLINLLTNAADAIPDGAPDDHTILVATRTDGAGRPVVEISDTGGGIAPAIRPRVFEPFFTTKAAGAGTGLGLSMCHQIVTELGGEIAFESSPGATTFRVTLPRAQATPARQAPRSSSRPAIRRRVLVVDDEPALLAAIERQFRDACELVMVPGAHQALAVLDDDTRFDAVLADLMMPGLTGVDLYHEVRARHPGLERRFLFMTGGVFSVGVERFLSSVPNRCIEKPFAEDELLHAIDELARS
jgi:PAS domain S-box-containing protein